MTDDFQVNVEDSDTVVQVEVPTDSLIQVATAPDQVVQVVVPDPNVEFSVDVLSDTGIEVYALERDHTHEPVTKTLTYGGPNGELTRVESSKSDKTLTYDGNGDLIQIDDSISGYRKTLNRTGDDLTSVVVSVI